MKVALIGYGKMGQIIEATLVERGHEIIAKFGREGIDTKELKKAEVAIEFSVPEAAFSNLKTCFENKVPVVTGTTGWLDRFEEAKGLCENHQSAFLYASNFSLGVNIFFAVNQHLAKLISDYNYHLSIEEIHHIHKKDAPSGTAISLAEQIIANNSNYNSWVLSPDNKEKSISIEAKRQDEVPGTHIIHYENEIDSIEISHAAKNRKGFALGAVLAAEYLKGKVGVFDMSDVLNLKP